MFFLFVRLSCGQQGLIQYLKAVCPKIGNLYILGILFFKGDQNKYGFQQQTVYVRQMQ